MVMFDCNRKSLLGDYFFVLSSHDSSNLLLFCLFSSLSILISILELFILLFYLLFSGKVSMKSSPILDSMRLKPIADFFATLSSGYTLRSLLL